MARPLRVEFEGALYHVTSRGDRREAIYRDDEDRRVHLAVIGQAMERFDARVLAYCLMGNHYHLVICTQSPNLSRLMRHLNGVYTQRFNQRHGLAGHLFQGRYKAILVDRETYLLALCRYVERNPVAAGLVREPLQWPWSSGAAHVGARPVPDWLDSPRLLAALLGREPRSPADRRSAAKRYAALLSQAQDTDHDFWEHGLTGQIYLGDESFALRMQDQAPARARRQVEVPRPQRLPQRSWQAWLGGAAGAGERDAALLAAYRSGSWTMTALAQAAGLSVSRVSRLISRQEGAAPRAGAKAKGKT